MGAPKLACCNFLPNVEHLREFAMDYGFSGVDWTLKPGDLPQNRSQFWNLAEKISVLKPLEIRYHLFFRKLETGHVDPAQANDATRTFHQAVQLISALGGRFMTVHVGLGRDSMHEVSWEKTLNGLANLSRLARRHGIRICLENLVSGWTGNPRLFTNLIRKSSCWGTLDIGHAQVCRSVQGGGSDIGDFVRTNPERILNAHIYHLETAEGHVPPVTISDVDRRLELLETLPLCDWWVLELRDETALLQSLEIVREFLQARRVSAAV